MEKQFKRTTVTSALPYANGPVHIGHLAGVYVPADIYVRYLRLKKEDVLFIGGSDEHGVPITIRAKKEGVTPQDVVDRYHTLIKKSFEEFGISFDVYSRTTSPTHHRLASDFFKTLYEKGEFVEKTSEQYYDEEAGQFLADRYIIGECPHCHSEGAYGDQCEKCGTSLSPTDLINPKSAISGSKPVMKETKHWYLPLDKHEGWLRQWILESHKEWRPNVYGQCKSWLDMGLQPRAVSRDLDWGIPVPVEGAEGKVLYVWFDAPIGYISNTKELLPDSWETWWKDPETRLVHFIGKDNIVFHCIVFPAMLKAEGSYILPDNVPGNEFLNLEGDKISTSRNWAVWLHEYLTDFPGKQDVLRYVLTANAPETKDNDFTWKDFQARNNNELVAVYGNFVNRGMVLTQKYFNGCVPVCSELTEYDRETLKEFADVKAEVEKLLDVFKFRDAQKEAMNLARIGNKYLADTEPWKLAKTDMERVGTILNISLQLVANLAIAFEPFLPFSSERLRKMLNMDNFEWGELGRSDLLPVGHQLNKPELLFEKIEDATIEAQVQKLLDTKKANDEANHKANPVRANIEFDDFLKLDIRVGTVLECQKVPKADKLLQFKIDDGLETRTIVSGIAKYYAPEELTGKQVCFIANLPPRKLKGIVSEGMILSAENHDGSLAVIMPGKEVKPGSEVK
ncbi:methionine--tRNA ligase [Bacteroides pyogenes]|uniref:methionine--tRNA ligase n=1 Tax=Bacteroides pyogenes TaxID=310300 RepID=UPI0011E46616|nr:methionine--tRNA ligase [Bacteroides pyogenes]MBR8707432.1 Methionine--tRNA ligase [Bacteroides pyogenes]MBR8716241.1 Methionine--tRNA ligase [Bacteroides pyogenes]MBR8745624.1 Methionine--tRNA ligase [Bacteroides pyogenes]MBR8756077.1 Methionine--tRNA ligase [Bacteroides pyogenes]MBR8779301.1 Methionine--tRNA ligase [Bacteroides pyogenes]